MRGPVTARCQVLGESGGSSFAVPVAVREGQRRPCLVPRGACGLGKGCVLTEVRRRCLRGFIARPWVLLWLVGFLVVCRDPGSTWPSGEQASVWPGSGESDASRLLSGWPSCEATGHCCVETVIAVEAATLRCPAGLPCLPGESCLLAPPSRV